ncbi:MAG TPA: serine hydrolase [Bacteroidetes bacterium]|nr:serine hydrolase [Bacteroidota bacterium]
MEVYMLFRFRVVSYLVLSVLCIAGSAYGQAELFKGLNDYILKSMRDWETPGLALAVVRNDSVIFARGYGVRKKGETAPVTAKTIFAIASTTKAMTAACLGMLVDEGKLKWDDPVTKYLPWFQLSDPYVTRELTVRDLLCHRSGLSRGDNLWYLSSYTREEVLRRVRFLKPAWSFRSRYGYQNIMFLAAGEMIPSVTSKSWDDFIADRLFKPLGMTKTSTSVKSLSGLDDVATPHDRIDTVMQPVRWPNFDNVGSAGAVNSCVEDMAQWIRMNLGGGMYRGKKILSADVVKEIQTPQTIIRLDSLDQVLRPSNHFAAYGFGWTLRDYLGRKLIQHDGALDGMRARVVLIPEEKFGFVILMNSSNTNLHASIAYRIIDHYLGGPVRDWSSELLKIAKEQEAKNRAEEKKQIDERARETKPSLPLESYTGKYEHEMYGEANVQLEGGQLTLRYFPLYVGPMTHWHYDTFQVVWDDRTFGKDLISFTLGADGKVIEMRWQGFTEFKKVK